VELFNGAHASIRVSLPTARCGEVKEIVEVLSALDDVYNHLYAWHALAHQVDPIDEGFQDRAEYLTEAADAAEAVPEQKRLCLARIEINPPAYVEVVGARYPLAALHRYLQGNHRAHNGRTHEGRTRAKDAVRMDVVRGEIDHLWGLDFPEDQLRRALSTHVIAPLARLDKLRGVEVYEKE
jgi:hypothetical protein